MAIFTQDNYPITYLFNFQTCWKHINKKSTEMEIGFLIPTYLLVIYTYGWWLYSRIIWVNAFTNYDLVFYLWLALTFIFHVGVIRTINSRYGYSKEWFSVKNFYGQWLIYLLGFPLIMLDWQCMRNFSYYLARTWNKFWIILYFLKLGAIASVWTVLGYYLDKDNYKMILSANFVFGFTVLTFLNHPWIMKIWLLIIYFVPFIVYIIAKIIIYPFTFWLWCWFWWKKRSDDSDANDSRSNRSDVAHEGGGDESNKDSNFDDINNMDSARDFDTIE